jgi:N-terminal acetyltransferase B complex catalytic subunit
LCAGSAERAYHGLQYAFSSNRPYPAFNLPFSVLGKAEGEHADWHGHVTALTVAPEYRRLGLARKMMHLLETVSDEVYKGFYVDLYVRCANHLAIDMYEGMGYSVFRRVREYYGTLGIGKGGRDEEDAFGECYSGPACVPVG